jgi:hypothetical protein
LTPEEIDRVRAWIEAGAHWQPHWAWVRPEAITPPDRSDHPIDAFVATRLDRAGLVAAGPADRATLLRRVSLDLTGLPATPEEIDTFLADQAAGAWLRQVDRLLASPHFGERWTRVWLDHARYADTKGYEKDDFRTIWPWRDWVIESINRDQPFDAFVIEQIAGDLLPQATEQQVLATAFHRNTMTNDEGGTDDEEFRVAAVVDRVNTTMQVFMGLTMKCAQCHDHPSDPWTQEAYYGLFAMFNQTADADRGDEHPVLMILSGANRASLEVAQAHLKQETQSGDADRIAAATTARDEVAALAVPVPVMRSVPADETRETHLLKRGSFLAPQQEVSPHTPPQLHPLEETDEPPRLRLARWLAADDNPLTARVHVNRVWERLFGIGLVETSEDFGTQGTQPTHPQLLDWLAVEFMKNGWSHKQLCRLIVTSDTYRRAAPTASDNGTQDPRNRLLAFAPRVRLEAEAIRDQALAVSGLLDRTTQGPSVYPDQPAGLWQVTYDGRDWPQGPDRQRHRRGLYTFWRRSSPYPSLTTFDAPSRETCVVRRIRTNTPLQSLVTLNDPVYVEAAKALAGRMVHEGGETLEGRIDRGIRLTLGRTSTPEERQRLVDLVAAATAGYQADPALAEALLADWPGDRPERINSEDLAALVLVANVLLNLDETLVRG